MTLLSMNDNGGTIHQAHRISQGLLRPSEMTQTKIVTRIHITDCAIHTVRDKAKVLICYPDRRRVCGYAATDPHARRGVSARWLCGEPAGRGRFARRQAAANGRGSHRCRQIVAHLVEDAPINGVAGVVLRESAWVDAHLGGRQRENQPASLQFDEAELEHVAEEGAIGPGSWLYGRK